MKSFIIAVAVCGGLALGVLTSLSAFDNFTSHETSSILGAQPGRNEGLF